MWKWTCPNTLNLIHEHHSWKSLNESLTGHEDGLKVPGFREIAPCDAIHDYWDNGEPCSVKGCKIPYIRDDEPVD